MLTTPDPAFLSEAALLDVLKILEEATLASIPTGDLESRR
jgi:hypothetical protein